MLIYSLIGSVFFIISLFLITYRFCGGNNFIDLERLAAFSMFSFLIIFTSFRIDSGFDFENYKNIFLGISDTHVEPLFLFLINIFRYTDSFHSFLFFIAFLSIYIKLYVFCKLKLTYLTFAVLLYYLTIFLNLDMGVLRQGIALSFIGIAFVFYLKSNSKCYFLSVLIASLFHLSAIIFIPFYFVFKLKLNLYFICVLILSSFIINALLSGQLAFISILLSFFGDKYSAYTNNLEPIGFTLGFYVKYFLFFIFYFLVSNRYIKNNDIRTSHINEKLLNACLIVFISGLVFFTCFNSIPIIAARTGGYFKFFELILFCYCLSIEKKTFYFYAIYITVLVYCFLQFVQFLSMEAVLLYYGRYNSLIIDGVL